MEIIVTVIAALLMLVAVAGTIFPIIPGSPVAVVTLIAWAWILGSSASWSTGVIGAALALVGMSASLVLTGRTMKREAIPKGPILVATASAVVGIFVIPFVGLFIGFALGLFAAEYVRRRDLQLALRSSLQALKAMGWGMVVECGCAILATGVFGLGVLLHFIG